MNTKTCCS